MYSEGSPLVGTIDRVHPITGHNGQGRLDLSVRYEEETSTEVQFIAPEGKQSRIIDYVYALWVYRNRRGIACDLIIAYMSVYSNNH